MIIRPAEMTDAQAMADLHIALFKAGKRSKPSDAAFTHSNYIAHPGRIECWVAVDDDGTLLGFQSLRLADASNPYGTPTGWGIIGTHISPMAARRGIGRALFDATLTAAREADLPAIEAFIGDTNQEGQAYYEAMGFRDWRDAEGAVCKAFRLA